MRRLSPLAFGLLALAGCDLDLPSGQARAATDTFPSAEAMVMSCFQANDRLMRQAEEEGVSYWEPPDSQQIVRRVQCQWEQGTYATALCRFEETYLPFGVDPATAGTVPDKDWEGGSARLVHVREGRKGWTHWVAPQGCKRLPDAS